MKIEVLKELDLPLLQHLVQLEMEAFGIGGLNAWHLVPLIRHGRVFIAYERNEAVGLIQFLRDWENTHKAYLMGVSIAEKMRGQGLGTLLVRDTIERLKKENISEIELTVDPENQAAIKVYKEKLGFVTIDKRINEYGLAEDRLIMTLVL